MELDKINLKITAGKIVTESKLTKPAKKQLINFIEKEASDHQLMALLLDGEVTQVNDESKEILEQRFYNSEIYKIVQEIGFFMAIPVYAAASYTAIKLFKNFMSEAKRKCGVIGVGKKRKACIAKANMDITKRKIGLLEKLARSECPKTKNPEKCSAKASRQIGKQKKQLMVQNKKLMVLIKKGVDISKVKPSKKKIKVI